MAWTGRDVSLRLRRELGDERLVVKFDPAAQGGRWVVCVRRKMLTGARRWPVAIGEGGELLAGVTTFREVAPLDDIVFILETDDGQYHSLEPNLMRRALIARDTHQRDVAREVIAEVRRRKAAKAKAFRDEVFARSQFYRRAFARVAEDMGYSGRPDYQQIYAPKRVYGI